jgi:hypothetical protein
MATRQEEIRKRLKHVIEGLSQILAPGIPLSPKLDTIVADLVEGLCKTYDSSWETKYSLGSETYTHGLGYVPVASLHVNDGEAKIKSTDDDNITIQVIVAPCTYRIIAT